MSSDFDKNSLALLRELKLQLYQIARRAELDNRPGPAIQARAEQSLRLIDSYMTSASAEHGQVAFELTPLSIGSVLHEAAAELKRQSTSNCQIVIEAKAHQPVMTNKEALSGLLASIGSVISDIADKTSQDKVILRSFTAKDGQVGVGVFTKCDNLLASDLETALQINGRAHMAIARHSARSGVFLTVADGLAKGLGGMLEVKRMGSLRGFATLLPRSEQLSLV